MEKIARGHIIGIARKKAKELELNPADVKPFTDYEIQRAFTIWVHGYHSKTIDKELTPFLNSDINAFSTDHEGWLYRVRKASFLSIETMAKSLNISSGAYGKYEKNEMDGSISLDSLAKAANALDCELVYAIRPQNKKHFSANIWEKILPAAIVHPWLSACDQRKRENALAYVAGRKMNDPAFRREQGWSTRANR